MLEVGMDSSASAQRQVTGSWEHDNEPSTSRNRCRWCIYWL